MSRPTIAIGLAAAAAFVLGAQPALAADEVTIKPGNPATSFSGTDKNTGNTTHNFVSIGTAGPEGQENNPIGSFSINGQSCQLYAAYGSAYCTVNIPPGATVNFTGTTQSPATTFTYCTSDNSGVDNDCNDVSTAGGGQTAPSSLLASFVHLDRDLTQVIDKIDGGEISGGAAVSAIKELIGEKHRLIGSGFRGQSLFGVPAAGVIIDVDLTDVFLERARAAAADGAHAGVIVAHLEAAKKRKQALEKRLHDAGKAPGKLQGALVRLDRHLTAVIDKVDGGNLSGSGAAAAIRGLIGEKHRLIGSGFRGVTLYGVPAVDVLVGFDLIDVFLERGRQAAHDGEHAGVIVANLEAAKRRKQALEAEFQGT